MHIRHKCSSCKAQTCPIPNPHLWALILVSCRTQASCLDPITVWGCEGSRSWTIMSQVLKISSWENALQRAEGHSEKHQEWSHAGEIHGYTDENKLTWTCSAERFVWWVGGCNTAAHFCWCSLLSVYDLQCAGPSILLCKAQEKEKEKKKEKNTTCSSPTPTKISFKDGSARVTPHSRKINWIFF